ncbi:META domain-containing protein [Paraburkholderia bonniea]|uniref:META domain-containing protein n=1 Tax=Paraburkholderia bonniea TaxID=2152891 RepID=UPI0012920240|nr:META domain-containing protein [Paraburkholderia bonniea]WJF92161.1 META domain-containing protein [Paraburkholderia bonniea]WJF95482.1 META domain-containing protein [Paraburkholderia bonniea]
MRPRRSFALLATATFLSACTMPTHPDASATAPDPFNQAATQLLDNTRWELTRWLEADGSLREVPHGDNGEPITLELSIDDGQRRASGYSGCNRYMGMYTLKDGKLSFGPLAGTRMACPGSAGGKLEAPYLDALAHIARTGVQMREPQALQLILDNGATLSFSRHEQ